METDAIEVEWIKEEPKEADSGQVRDQYAKNAACEKKDSHAEDAINTQEFAFLREGGRCYLTCASKGDCDDEEAMLAGNRPEGYLIVTRKSMNGQVKLFFDITGKQSLLRCYEKNKISFEELTGLLASVKSALDRVEEYLLSEDGLMLSPAYLYRAMSGKQLYFVYLPSPSGTFAQHIRELAHFLMEHVDYGEDPAVELAGRFFQYAEAENFNMTVFLEENRSCFEHSGSEKEQEEKADDLSGAGMPKQDEAECMEEGDRRRSKNRRPVWAGAAAVGFLAVWLLHGAAWLLVPAGICAGISAVILPYCKERAEQTLLKKEREIYLFSEERI